jgi:hypothetical protein
VCWDLAGGYGSVKCNTLDQLGRPEHFLDQNVQSLAVLGVEAQPACGFRGTLPSAILHALVTTA